MASPGMDKLNWYTIDHSLDLDFQLFSGGISCISLLRSQPSKRMLEGLLILLFRTRVLVHRILSQEVSH